MKKICILINQMIQLKNNPYHITVTMKPVDVKPSTYIDSSKETDLKLMMLLEYENIKPFLQKAMFQIGLKKIL